MPSLASVSRFFTLVIDCSPAQVIAVVRDVAKGVPKEISRHRGARQNLTLRVASTLVEIGVRQRIEQGVYLRIKRPEGPVP